MTDDKKELEEMYRKDGRFKKEDDDRLIEKAVSQATGEEKYSDFTTRAMRYVHSGYKEQEKQAYSVKGSSDKRLHGFLLAARKLVRGNPEISPRQAWKLLPNLEVNQWTFYLDCPSDMAKGDMDEKEMVKFEMVQRYNGRDKKIKKSQDYKSIKFNSFRRGYIDKAKKELSHPVK